MSQASKRRSILALTFASIVLVGFLPMAAEARRGFPEFVDTSVSPSERLSVVAEAIFGVERGNAAAAAGSSTGECGWWDWLVTGCSSNPVEFVAPTSVPETGAPATRGAVSSSAPRSGDYYVDERVIERVVVREENSSATRALLERLGVLEAQVARFDGRIEKINGYSPKSARRSRAADREDTSASIDAAVSGGSSDASFGSLAVSGAATSTFANGLDIDDGCFAVDGVCLGLGSGADGTFSTSSADHWIVSSSTIPHVGGTAYGDVLYWTGSAWSKTATSTLGIDGSKWDDATGGINYSGGNVGIGVANPTFPLDVLGTIRGQAIYSTDGVSLETDSSLVFDQDGDAFARILTDASDVYGYGANSTVLTSANGVFAFENGDGGGFVMAMNAVTGNVGIGTTTPGSLLSLGSLANFTTATSTFYSTGGINLADGCFAIDGVCVGGGSSQWTTTGSDIYYNTGNVGIANASPANKLDIIGNARIQSGKLILGDQVRDDSIDFYGNQYTLGLRGYTLFAKSPQMFRYESGISNGAYNAFEIGTSGGATFLAVNNSGYLGIGTSTPFSKLGVAGDAYIGGNLTATGTLAVAGTASIVTAGGDGSVVLTLGNGIGSNTIAKHGWHNALDFGSAALLANELWAPGGIMSSANAVIGYDAEVYVPPTDGMIVEGNVGVGTSTPSAKLAVTGSGTGTGRAFVVANSSSVDKFVVDDSGSLVLAGSVTSQAGLNLNAGLHSNIVLATTLGSLSVTNGGYLRGVSGSVSSPLYSFTGDTDSGMYSVSADKLSLVTGGADRLTIDSSGNVGVGTSTPGAKLHALGTTEQLRLGYDATKYSSFTTGSTGALTIAAGGTGQNLTLNPSGGGIVLIGGDYKEIGSSSNTALVLDFGSDLANAVTFLGSGGRSTVIGVAAAGVRVRSDHGYNFSANTDTRTSADTGIYRLSAATVAIGNGTAANTSGTLVASNVGVGTTTPYARLSVHAYANATNANTIFAVASSTPSATTTHFAVSNAGAVYVGSLVGGATNVTVDANGNLIRDPSDANLKENVEAVASSAALEKVLLLRGVTFDWRDQEKYGPQRELGFIAQEVQAVIPEAVSSGGDYLSLSVKPIVAALVGAVQAVWAEVESLAASVGSMSPWFADDGSRLEVQGDVCVDGVCVTREQFKGILLEAGGSAPAFAPDSVPADGPEEPVAPEEPSDLPDEPVAGDSGGVAPADGATEGDTSSGEDAGPEASGDSSVESSGGSAENTGDGSADSGEASSPAESGSDSSGGESAGGSGDSSPSSNESSPSDSSAGDGSGA